MQHPTSRTLYAYWNALRGDRIAPRRFDIEPSQLGAVLAETLILECDVIQPATFRLAGTKVCDSFGREFRGAPFLTLFRAEDHAGLTANLHHALTQGSVLVVDAVATIDDARRVRFEILLLPLVHSGTALTRMLGSIAAIEPPAWLGQERLPALEVQRTEQIWPEGRPHAIAEKFRNQPALMPELAGARLVRINRRSFRILDGGISSAGAKKY